MPLSLVGCLVLLEALPGPLELRVAHLVPLAVRRGLV